MTHASKEMLVALADGELGAADEARVLRHLEGCTACAATLGEVHESRAAFASVLGAVDATEPAAWLLAADRLPDLSAGLDETGGGTHARAADILDIRRARAAGSTRPPHAARSATRRSAPPAWRWAAGILLAGAAAAAVLREPLLNAFRTDATPPEVAIAPTSTQAQTQSRGMFVTPVDGEAEIELVNGAAGTRVAIGFHDRAEVLVEPTSDGAPQLTHGVGGRARADLAGERHDLRIVVPADLARVRILADGVVLAVIEAGRLTQSATDRGYVIEAEPTGR